MVSFTLHKLFSPLEQYSMLFVDIDIAKKRHQAAITYDDGKRIGKAVMFSNAIDGFNLFLDKVGVVTPSFHSSKLVSRLQVITDRTSIPGFPTETSSFMS